MRPNACKSVKQDFLWLAWLSRRQWCQASIYFPQKFLKEILFPKWIGFPIFNACFKLSLLVTLIKLMRAILLFVCYFFLSIAGQKYHKHVMYISSLLIFFWLSEVVLWCSSWLSFSHVTNPFLPSFWLSDGDRVVQIFRGPRIWVLSKKRQALLRSLCLRSNFSAFANGGSLDLVHTT